MPKAEIVEPREWVETVEYFLYFEKVGTPGAGFSFPCNEQGEILQDGMCECGFESYKRQSMKRTESRQRSKPSS